MRIKYFLLIILLPFITLFGQTASNYFPSQTGYKWYYKSVPLDSVNNPMDSLSFYGIDSFAVAEPFNGRTANIVVSKTGGINIINALPFSDSLYFSFDGSNGYEYFNPELVSGLIGSIDTTLGIDFFNFFNSLEGWYSYYRFSAAVSDDYQVFKKDTTVIIDSANVPLRFELYGMRLADETISTAIGSFNCKKFLLERRLSYLLFNIIPVKILGVEETVWLAPDNWKVKSYVPSTFVDFSEFGFPEFTVPGLETNIINPITSIEEGISQVNDFGLFQNYPNPFNPSTSIKYAIASNQFVQLKVYNLLGREIATLVNEYKPAGIYEVEFTIAQESIPAIASGIYFYQLKTENVVYTKKMVLVK